MNDVTKNKMVVVLQSRKFWSSVISLLVVLGLFKFSDMEQTQLVESLVLIAPIVIGGIYTLATAIEDAAHAKGGTAL